MVTKSWIVTIIPLIVYLLGFGYSLACGCDFTPQQSELLTGMLTAFIGSAAVGGGLAAAKSLRG